MSSSSAYNYYNENENNKNIIQYEFKQEFKVKNNNSKLDSSVESNTTSSQIKNNNSLDDTINKMIEDCTNKYKELFVKTMLDEYIEDGYISNSQKLYSIIESEYGYIVSSLFLNNIYMEYAINNKIIKSLLYIMSRLDPKYLNGIDIGISAFALNNKDYEIRDFVLQCFEKWNDKRYLPLLKSLKLDVDFLQEYLDIIIMQIESES